MFEKNLDVGLLLDFYGDILSDRKKQVLDLYYNDDLSLSEIAEQLDITRQAVRELIKKAESELYFYEDKLKLMNRFNASSELAQRVISACRSETVRNGFSEEFIRDVELLAETVLGETDR